MLSFLRKFNHLVLSLAVYSLGLQPAFANLHLADQREDARASRFVSVF